MFKTEELKMQAHLRAVQAAWLDQADYWHGMHAFEIENTPGMYIGKRAPPLLSGFSANRALNVEL